MRASRVMVVIVVSLISVLWVGGVIAQETTPEATPEATAETTPEATPEAMPDTPATSGGETYVVQAGDTLFRIAQRFNTTVDELAALNGIANPALIFVGQELTLTGTPAATPTPTPEASPTPESTATPTPPPPPPGDSYTVQPGDTLFRIAARFDTTVADLVALNNIANPSLIFWGTQLRLPAGADDAPPATETPATDVTPDATDEAAPPVATLPDVTFAYGIEVYLTGQDVNALNSQLQQLGVNWVKITANWRYMEPTQGQIDFSLLDPAIETFSASGLNVLVMLTNAPDWARAGASELDLGENGPPDDVTWFGDFAGALAERYAGQVSAYEVWQTPNLRTSWRSVSGEQGTPRMSDVDYLDLLEAGYDAIKAADPEATVVTASLAPTGYNDRFNAIDDRVFLREMVRNNGLEHSDALGAHPFGAGNPPDAVCCEQPVGVDSHFDDPRLFFLDTLTRYRDILVSEGAGDVPLWVTRFGWPTAEGENLQAPGTNFEYVPYTSESEQALYLPRAFELGQAQGYVGPMFLHNLNACVAQPRGPAERVLITRACFYSLIDASGTARPAFNAVQNIDKTE